MVSHKMESHVHMALKIHQRFDFEDDENDLESPSSNPELGIMLRRIENCQWSGRCLREVAMIC